MLFFLLFSGSTTKKVLITSNPTQNVILKTTAPPKAQVRESNTFATFKVILFSLLTK